MAKHYDVIVVGAGNGGLVAAATTARAGLSTLLLERHNLPGGSASTFRRGRFEFEPSLHELCSVGNEENPSQIYTIFKDLGCEIDWQYEFKTFRAIMFGEDGFDVSMRAGVDAFCEDMERAVPGSAESVRAFFDLVRKNEEALAYVAAMKGNPNKLKMVLKHADFMRCASHSVEAIEEALGMPQRAREIMNTYWCYLGVPTDELNAMHYLSMVGSYVEDGAAMPKKRSHELSLALEKALLSAGGELWYNSEVVRFLYDEKGGCAGVVLSDGTELYAKEVISNVIPHNVYAMSPKECVPERELRLANSRELGITFVTVYLGLDCTKEELGVEDYTVFKMNCANPREQYDRRKEVGMYYVCNCLNVVIEDASPEGTCMLFFTIPMFGEDMPKDLKPEEYKKWKNDIARQSLEDSEKCMGLDIRSHIEEISVATPVTFAHYLGTPGGEIYGYQNSGWDSVIMRTQSQMKDFTVPHLTYCGGHSVRGDGYSSAYITGQDAALRVIKRIKGGIA